MPLFLHLFNKLISFFVSSLKRLYLCAQKAAGRLVAGTFSGARGKSGQHRASYLLMASNPRGLSSGEENNRPLSGGGKGEKVR